MSNVGTYIAFFSNLSSKNLAVSVYRLGSITVCIYGSNFDVSDRE